jgi:hypothetical protein
MFTRTHFTSSLSPQAEALRRAEIAVRRAADPYTRVLREQELRALQARTAPRRGR